MNKKALFIGTAMAFGLIFVGATTLYTNEKIKGSSINKAKIERASAPFKGDVNAKVTIVEFFDPACETCRQFYPLVNRILKKNSGKVKLIKRYAPLHQGSDQVVKILEAAHLQGKFWPAVALLYKSQNNWVQHHVAQPKLALALLDKIRLEPNKLAIDLDSEVVNATVMQDINDGKMLNVRATPQFFVNGKPLINFGYEPLVQMVESAINESYNE